jgi:hypothetical protein
VRAAAAEERLLPVGPGSWPKPTRTRLPSCSTATASKCARYREEDTLYHALVDAVLRGLGNLRAVFTFF